MRIKFENANIVVCNESFDILQGVLVTNNNVIEYVGDSYSTDVDRVVDCKGGYLMPGLINAHTHIEDNVEYYIDDMISNGITTIVALNNEPLRTAKVMNEKKVRGVVGVNCVDYDTAISILEELKSYPNISVVAYAPNMYNLSDDDYINYIKVCKLYGIPFTTHVSESLYDVGQCDKEYGMSPVKLLESYGMFDIPCIIVGATHIDKEDIEILSRYGVDVVSTPSSNMMMGYGIAPVYAMAKNNINIGIGTDEVSGNDIFREMYNLVSLQRGIMRDDSILDSSFAIQSATLNSARMYGLNNGVLQKDRFSDIILLEARESTSNISDSIAYYTNPKHIKFVLIDGNIVFDSL